MIPVFHMRYLRLLLISNDFLVNKYRKALFLKISGITIIADPKKCRVSSC